MRRASLIIAGLLVSLTVAAVPAAANETITYTYDALGRLVAVSTSGTGPTDGQSVSTQFDPAGNRTSYTVNGVTPPPVVTIAASAGMVTEGDALTFMVSLSAPAAWPISVNYSTADGTATAPSDYAAANSIVVNFSPGMVSQTVLIATQLDQATEPTETMQADLAGASGATIGTPNSAVGSILDRKPDFVIVPLNGYTLIRIGP